MTFGGNTRGHVRRPTGGNHSQYGRSEVARLPQLLDGRPEPGSGVLDLSMADVLGRS